MQVGNRVCYSKKFLQSTGQLTGDIPAARGVITKLMPLGTYTTLAVIDWGKLNDFVPRKVNIANLTKIGDKGIQD